MASVKKAHACILRLTVICPYRPNFREKASEKRPLARNCFRDFFRKKLVPGVGKITSKKNKTNHINCLPRLWPTGPIDKSIEKLKKLGRPIDLYPQTKNHLPGLFRENREKNVKPALADSMISVYKMMSKMLKFDECSC